MQFLQNRSPTGCLFEQLSIVHSYGSLPRQRLQEHLIMFIEAIQSIFVGRDYSNNLASRNYYRHQQH